MNEPSKFANEPPPAMPALRQRLARALPLLILCTGLALLLCACTPSIVMIPDAPRCLDYVPQSLWEPTPPAPLPADSSAGAWVAFANSQTGRLAEANEKPPAVRHIIGTCEQRHADAVAKAERQSLPWWKRLL